MESEMIECVMFMEPGTTHRTEPTRHYQEYVQDEKQDSAGTRCYRFAGY